VKRERWVLSWLYAAVRFASWLAMVMVAVTMLTIYTVLIFGGEPFSQLYDLLIGAFVLMATFAGVSYSAAEVEPVRERAAGFRLTGRRFFLSAILIGFSLAMARVANNCQVLSETSRYHVLFALLEIATVALGALFAATAALAAFGALLEINRLLMEPPDEK